MPTADVNGARLFYAEEREGEPLVVLHGSWLDHGEWLPVARLLGSSFRVVAFDRRGHGRSESSDDDGSFTQDAADLEALLEQLDLSPAHVVAHSTGGTIALRLAAGEHEAAARRFAAAALGPDAWEHELAAASRPPLAYSMLSIVAGRRLI